jgi:putative ABC transport system permease protein
LLNALRLAINNLTADSRRFALSLAGVSFAVVLMFAEAGFYNALLDASVSLIDSFDADLVMTSKIKSSLQAYGGFPRRRLIQALSVPGVAEVRPLYLEEGRSVWRADAEYFQHEQVPRDRRAKRQPIRALGIDPDAPALRLADVRGDRDQLELPNRVLLDTTSGPDYGHPERSSGRDELAGRDVGLAGTFTLGRDFVHDGNLVMGLTAWEHYFPIPTGTAMRNVEAGMIKLLPGADPHEVKQRLRELRAGVPSSHDDPGSGDDVRIFTIDEFRDQERSFWRNSTPIGFIFGLGLIMGLIVGLVICYQILSTDVTERLGEYATLKAMGYSNRFLGTVVLLQALCLALTGFVPGLLATLGLYHLLSNVTGLLVYLNIWRILFVLGLAIVMCAVSGMITVRKVQTADPASLF